MIEIRRLRLMAAHLTLTSLARICPRPLSGIFIMAPAQRWASRKAYEDYFKWRTDDGYTAKFEEMLEKPLAIRFFNEIPTN